MFDGKRVVIVVATGKNREIGNDNKLLWHIPEDLKRFKKLTEGHPIILGRKTFESIVSYIGKPLPGRTNIVVTRDANWRRDDVVVASSLEEAFIAASNAPGSEEIHIGGGSQIYQQALKHVDTLHLTIVDSAPVADSFFPEYENDFQITSDEAHESNGLKYRWVDLERKQ
jgi:dihydrofolate reductase